MEYLQLGNTFNKYPSFRKNNASDYHFDIHKIKHFLPQIFHIPMEERAYKQSEFGQGMKDQNKVCMDIMKLTKTIIEISTCRDGSLSLLVSGRADDVLKARREIYNRLQTQVRAFVD